MKKILIAFFLFSFLGLTNIGNKLWIFEPKYIVANNEMLLGLIDQSVFYLEKYDNNNVDWGFRCRLSKGNWMPITEKFFIILYFTQGKNLFQLPIKIKVNCKDRIINIQEEGRFYFRYNSIRDVDITISNELWRECKE